MILKNWKTLLGGAIIAGSQFISVLPDFFTAIAPILPPKYAAIATGLGALIVALSAKDLNVTGGTIKQ